MSKCSVSIGDRFSRLIVVAPGENRRIERSGNLERFWLCKCDCGRIKEIRSRNLKHIQSCGCYAKEHPNGKTHGMRNTPEFNCWCKMRRRCQNKNDSSYSYYGGRGISVCLEWEVFQSFIDYMGRKPTRAHSIDRIDVNGNYEPGNVRWATMKTQQNNRRNNISITIDGKSYTLPEAASLHGIKYNDLYHRIKRDGVEPKEAILQLQSHQSAVASLFQST